MPIVRPLATPQQDQYADLGPEVIQLDEPTNEGVQLNDDGSATIDLEEGGEQGATADLSEHDINLAAYLPPEVLAHLSSELDNFYRADMASRKDWEKANAEAIKLLGFNYEERADPWPNACGAFHPVLAEAVIRYQANAIMEIFPASGPVRTTIIGKSTRDKEKQAARVRNELNYQLTEVLTEYRAETEQLLLRKALSGSCFRKVYFDPIMKRPTAVTVPAEDMLIPYGTSDLRTAPRFAQIMRLHMGVVEKMIAAGIYREVKIEPHNPPPDSIKKAQDKVHGQKPSGEPEIDDRALLLEWHIDLVIEGVDDGQGLAVPYIVTMDKDSGEILSIYRNWEADDPLRLRVPYFAPYLYMPGFGPYGIGLGHILGGLAKASTSLLRQMVDGGTLTNLRSGYKTRGMRVKGDDRPLKPGELRDVDVLSGTLRDNIFIPEFKGPSAELNVLLEGLVNEARRVGSVADAKISDTSAQTPVGTTLAIFERNMKVQSAVQARLHASMRYELKLLSKLIAKYSARYDYEIDGDPAIKQQDFDPKIIDVVPVSDPNAGTMAQKIMQHQAAMQLAGGAPQLYDLPEMHRQMLAILGFDDPEKMVPQKEQMAPLDPVTENMAILTQKPVKAFIDQDHESHLKVHLAAVSDPQMAELVGQSPNANMIMGAMAAHVQEHMAFAYRRKVERHLGVPLPSPEQPIPPDVEANLSAAIASAAEKALAESKAEAAQKKAQELAEDPVFLLQKEEVAAKKQEIARKSLKDVADTTLKAKDITLRTQTALADQASRERIANKQIAADSAQAAAERQLAKEQGVVSSQLQAVETGRKIGKDVTDSQTAKAKIEADKKKAAQKKPLTKR